MRPDLRIPGGILALLLLVPAAGGAAEAPENTGSPPVSTPVKKPVAKPAPKLSKPRSVEISIPYPNAGMYLYRGIYGSFAGGRFNQTQLEVTNVDPVLQDTTRSPRWQDPLFQWQGEVSYFYTDWFSGGFGFKINAGETGNGQLVLNRYFLLARFHKAWPKAAAFAGVNLGVDDVSLSLTPLDTLDFREPLTETNAALGLEVGGGWKFSRYVGATLGQRMDFSLVRQEETSSNDALGFRTQPGLALDMVRVMPSLRESVKALYVLAEVQFGQRVLFNGDIRHDLAWITGLSLAF